MTVPLGHQAIDDPLLRFAKAHPALSVAGFTTAVFVIKVLFVAHLNTAVALGIVSAVGPADLVTGLLTLLFPTLALLFAYVLAIWTFVYFKRGRRAAVLFDVTLLVAVFALITAPVGTLLAFIVVTGLGIGVGYWFGRRRRRTGKTGKDPWPEIVWRLVGLGLGFFVVVTAQPTVWLPAEVFQIDDAHVEAVGYHENVGYFIEEDGEWITVLSEIDRRLLRIRPEQISARQVCGRAFPRGWLNTAAWNLLNRDPGALPPCEAASSAGPRVTPSP